MQTTMEQDSPSPNKSFSKWKTFYTEQQGRALRWPNETLVRLVNGHYLPSLSKNFGHQKVLDIGFGWGNNSAFLASLGCQISGTEVDPEICRLTRERLRQLGFAADLRCGTNDSLPFEDGSFDLAISWNVLHYQSEESLIEKALREYKRVLKPGAHLLVSTTGPRNSILRESQKLSANQYCIGRSDDFRKGEIYYYFNTAEEAAAAFQKEFREVQVGRTLFELFEETLDWFIITAVK